MKLLSKALGFVIGFSTIFIFMEIPFSFAGSLLNANKQWFEKIGGILICIFGLHTLGVFKIKLLYREKRVTKVGISNS